jgi:hypothetical protein
MIHHHTIPTTAMGVLALIATALTTSVETQTADRTVKLDAGMIDAAVVGDVLSFTRKACL